MRVIYKEIIIFNLNISRLFIYLINVTNFTALSLCQFRGHKQNIMWFDIEKPIVIIKQSD